MELRENTSSRLPKKEDIHNQGKYSRVSRNLRKRTQAPTPKEPHSPTPNNTTCRKVGVKNVVDVPTAAPDPLVARGKEHREAAHPTQQKLHVARVPVDLLPEARKRNKDRRGGVDTDDEWKE